MGKEKKKQLLDLSKTNLAEEEKKLNDAAKIEQTEYSYSLNLINTIKGESIEFIICEGDDSSVHYKKDEDPKIYSKDEFDKFIDDQNYYYHNYEENRDDELRTIKDIIDIYKPSEEKTIVSSPIEEDFEEVGQKIKKVLVYDNNLREFLYYDSEKS